MAVLVFSATGVVRGVMPVTVAVRRVRAVVLIVQVGAAIHVLRPV
jgi:hypothetical protein